MTSPAFASFLPPLSLAASPRRPYRARSYLDITEAIEEGDQHAGLDNADFAETEVPFPFHMPNKNFLDDHEREKVHASAAAAVAAAAAAAPPALALPATDGGRPPSARRASPRTQPAHNACPSLVAVRVACA
jgi:hypothetical protein